MNGLASLEGPARERLQRPGDRAHRERCDGAVFDGFITKPIALERFVTRVCELLAEHAAKPRWREIASPERYDESARRR